MKEFVHIGHDNYVNKNEIQAVLAYSGKKLKSEIIERRKQIADNGKSLIYDCTAKQTCRSVVVTKDGVYYLSVLLQETLIKRIDDSRVN